MYSQKELYEMFPMRIVKEYDKNKKVSREDMEKIVELGRYSPSSFRLEPWKFLVIENDAMKEKIRRVSWGINKQASTCSYIVVILSKTANEMKYNSDFIRNMFKNVLNIPEDKLNARIDRYKRFLEDDFEILEDEGALFGWSSRQSYIALTNMMIKATSMGISSCPIEGFNKSQLECVLSEEGLLAAEEYGVSVMVTFGYELEESDFVYINRNRRELEDVVQWV